VPAQLQIIIFTLFTILLKLVVSIISSFVSFVSFLLLRGCWFLQVVGVGVGLFFVGTFCRFSKWLKLPVCYEVVCVCRYTVVC